jgi:hypothetical protein
MCWSLWFPLKLPRPMHIQPKQVCMYVILCSNIYARGHVFIPWFTSCNTYGHHKYVVLILAHGSKFILQKPCLPLCGFTKVVSETWNLRASFSVLVSCQFTFCNFFILSPKTFGDVRFNLDSLCICIFSLHLLCT